MRNDHVRGRNARTPYDRTARERPTKLSSNSDRLERVRSLEINLTTTLEEQLGDRISKQEREDWIGGNRTAIEAYDDRIERDGAFGDRARRF